MRGAALCSYSLSMHVRCYRVNKTHIVTPPCSTRRMFTRRSSRKPRRPRRTPAGDTSPTHIQGAGCSPSARPPSPALRPATSHGRFGAGRQGAGQSSGSGSRSGPSHPPERGEGAARSPQSSRHLQGVPTLGASYEEDHGFSRLSHERPVHPGYQRNRAVDLRFLVLFAREDVFVRILLRLYV